MIQVRFKGSRHLANGRWLIILSAICQPGLFSAWLTRLPQPFSGFMYIVTLKRVDVKRKTLALKVTNFYPISKKGTLGLDNCVLFWYNIDEPES